MSKMNLKKLEQKFKKIDQSICAPNRQFKNENSCYSHEALKRMALAYNKQYKNRKQIKVEKTSFNELHNNLMEGLIDVCDNEICWSKQRFVKDLRDEEINKYTFKPMVPGKKGEDLLEVWLSTSDIDNVLNQYARKFDDFIYLGTFPIDFQQLYRELKNFDLNKYLKKGINKFGMVLNTDPSWKDGEHWISLYFEFSPKRQEIAFFDSGSRSYPKEIKEFIEKIKKNSKELGFNPVINDRPKKSHQLKDTACGVYSLNFITHMLLGDSYEKFTEDIIRDAEMNRRRSIYFRGLDI